MCFPEHTLISEAFPARYKYKPHICAHAHAHSHVRVHTHTEAAHIWVYAKNICFTRVLMETILSKGK